MLITLAFGHKSRQTNEYKLIEEKLQEASTRFAVGKKKSSWRVQKREGLGLSNWGSSAKGARKTSSRKRGGEGGSGRKEIEGQFPASKLDTRGIPMDRST